ncbi:MAG: DNA-packaging protein [Pseudomonas sp.]|nr:DNA-packaging protein [Pseudomonas sp.]
MNWLRILAPVLIYLSCTLSGAFLGYRYAERSGLLALEQLRRDHADAERAQALLAADSAKAAAKKLLDEQAHNDKLAADLADQQRTHRKTTDRLTGEIARVNDLYVKALDAEPEPLPACVFTAGWVRVYDEATGASAAGMPSATDTGRAAAQVAEGRAAEQLDSGISQRDVLEHHTRYAEQCRNTAAQLDLLIDAVKGEQ